MFGQLICKCGKPAIHTFRFPGKEWFCPSCKIASTELGGYGKYVYRPPTDEEKQAIQEQQELFREQIEKEATNATP